MTDGKHPLHGGHRAGRTLRPVLGAGTGHPRGQSSIRGERLVATAQVKLPARSQEFEIQIPFTRWVNQLPARFRLQTLLQLALAHPILNLNCGLQDDRNICGPIPFLFPLLAAV